MKNIIIFIIFIIILVLIKYEFNIILIYKSYVVKTYRKIFGINKQICYHMMNDVKDTLDKYNIKFWLSEGTALGIYRDGDLIEYDDDVDFSFRGDIGNQYNIFLKNVIPELNSKGYICNSGVGKNKNLYYAMKNNHFIDFDIVMPNWHCIARNGPCNELIPYIEKLETITWRGKTWNIPTKEYLIYLYGKTWNIPIRNYKP
jgi:hypothetical protein